MGSATPSQSAQRDCRGRKARSGTQNKRQSQWQVRASKGTNPCTRPSFATKNVVDVLQDLSESIEDHPDRSWMLQMGSLSPLSTTCTSRLLSFWNGRRS